MANSTNGGAQPIAGVGIIETQEEDMLDESRRQLRRRWELASVLNFFRVFEPVIGKELKKMSAEEIETSLIVPNDSLAKLHIILLKGIPPVSKNLSNPDAWVTSLCKKLAEWWPWVAEGDIPLTAGNGKEISRYKELDPAVRLSMLKALCELRTEQDDLMSYINDALKQGTDVSHFQVDKISENRSGISFWYDGDTVMGYRLYKEVNKPQPKLKYRGKGGVNQPPVNLEWETLATNLDEFHKVAEELSSSSDLVEGAIYQAIETEVIPALEKLKKKEERNLKRRQRDEAFLNNNYSCVAAFLNNNRDYVATRTCRTRKPVKYTFDDYDQAIEEAIKVTRERNDQKVKKNVSKLHATDGDLLKDTEMEETSPGSTDVDEQNDGQQAENSGNDGDTKHAQRTNKNVDTKVYDSDNSSSQGQNGHVSSVKKSKDSPESDSSSGYHSQQPCNFRAKNRLRQRPTENSSLKSTVVPDSDFDASSKGYLSEVADSEDDISS